MTAAPLDIVALRDFVERYRLAWNSRDPARVLALATDDVVWEDPTILQRRAVGHAAVRAWLVALWRANPDLEFAYLDDGAGASDGVYVVPGDATRAVVPWRCTGTMLGPMDPPGFAPTNRRFALEGVDLYTFRGGRVCHVRTIADMYHAALQMGMLPSPASPAVRALVLAQRGLAALLRVRGLVPQRRA